MRLRSASPMFLIWWCLLALGPAVAAEPDEVALARCDSLLATEQFAEAMAGAQALLATIDARGDGASRSAAATLTLLVRAYVARGGRPDPPSRRMRTASSP